MNGPPVFDAATFARTVRVRIAELGIQQKVVAEEVGIHTATLCRILKGTHGPSADSYLRLKWWLDQTADRAPSEQDGG